MSTLALLVPGGGTPLASALVDVCRPLSSVPFCRPLATSEVDLFSAPAVHALVGEWARVVRSDSPDHRLVVVMAAEAAAAEAEREESWAYALNATAPAVLASACLSIGASLLQVSTAEVFAGDRSGPPYDVDDEPAPRTAYGRTKLAGEHAVRALLPDASWVVRTGDVYGGAAGDLVDRVVAQAEGDGPVEAAADRVTSPTWVRDVARGLYALLREDVPPGTYHCASSGTATEAELAAAVLEELGAEAGRVQPVTGRPSYAVLSDASWRQAGLPVMPQWRDSLREAFQG